VADYFTAYGVSAVVAEVGLKFRSFALNQNAPGGGNRVCFIPGKFDGNGAPRLRAYGALDRNVRNHASVENPRELLNWNRPATISVWSAPVPGNKDNEGATINLAEDLLEQVVRAVNTAGLADITWGDVVYNAPVENPFGVEFLVSITQRGPLFDVTREYVQATPSIPRD
jgi:hypothetical protein